ncbi:MAG: retropepsin-like domain-containing protein [Saprospiraceae bacterium]|nr:retropepsin-like domain-containing protein [Saprospiraceae bacterium]
MTTMFTFLFYLPYSILLWMIFSPADSSVSESPQTWDGKPVYAEIPFRVERDKILVTIRIANTDRTFLVDTGAPFMIDAALAAEMGYAPVGAKNLKDAAGNTALVNTLRVPELVLGDIRFSNLQARSMIFETASGLLRNRRDYRQQPVAAECHPV